MQGPWNTGSAVSICRESPARRVRKRTAMTGRTEKNEMGTLAKLSAGGADQIAGVMGGLRVSVDDGDHGD